MDIGGKLLASLLAGKNVITYHAYKLNEDHFIGEEVLALKFIDNHIKEYGVLPSLSTVKANGFALPEVSEPSGYYLQKTEDRFRHRLLSLGLKDAQDLMKIQDTTTALLQLEEIVRRAQCSAMRHSVGDFAQDGFSAVTKNYFMMLTEQQAGLWFGWPKFDVQCEGLGAGDLVSVVGRPGMGKTMLTLISAHYTWRVKGGTVLYISEEMPMLEIYQRLVAMSTPYDLKSIQSSNITTFGLELIRKAGKAAKKIANSLWIADSTIVNTAEDVVALIQQLRPTGVLIDSAYLLGHSDKRLNKGQRIDANAEFLQKAYRKFGIPGYHTYQLNRDAAKKANKDNVGLEDIYASDSVGQLSAIVLGLFEDESVENSARRRVTVMKGRRGQLGSFLINWDFQKMNFSMIDPDADKITEFDKFL